jgi:hypothetical protein
MGCTISSQTRCPPGWSNEVDRKGERIEWAPNETATLSERRSDLMEGRHLKGEKGRLKRDRSEQFQEH